MIPKPFPLSPNGHATNKILTHEELGTCVTPFGEITSCQ